MKFQKLILTVLCLTGLSACSTSPFKSEVEYGFALNWQDISFKSDGAKKDTLRGEQFKLNLTRVSDLRTPEDRVLLDETGIIYDYQPDKLVNGIEGYVTSSMNKYMRYSDKAPVQLGLEVDIKHFKTTIEQAILSRNGEYHVVVELEYLVRDAESNVLMREKIVAEDTKTRRAVRGRFPSAKQDKKEIKKLLKKVMGDITLDLGWMVHSAFNQQRKYYNPMKELNDWLPDS